MINWCSNCLLPDTRPNIFIYNNGICNACSFGKKKDKINWSKKKRELIKLFNKIKRKSKYNYDCLIPVSGGKDSTWQVYNCLKYGLTPLAVTYKSPGRNNFGEKNLQNLISLGVDHVDFTINPKIEAYFMLKTLKTKGSTAIPMHLSIYNLPTIFAKKFNIPKKLDSFDKVINTSFCIFEKRDFLNKEQYIKLKKTFPDISYFTKIEKGVSNFVDWYKKFYKIK